MSITRKSFPLLLTRKCSASLLVAIPLASVLSLLSLSVAPSGSFAQSAPERARLTASRVDTDSATLTLQPTANGRDFMIVGEQSRVMPVGGDFSTPTAAVAKVAAPLVEPSNLGTFLLIDAETNKIVRELAPKERVFKRRLPKTMSIAFQPAQKFAGLVVFHVNGKERFRAETAPPYAIAGDNGGDYNNWTPRIGENIIEVSLPGRSQSRASLHLVVTEREEENPLQPQPADSEDSATLPAVEPVDNDTKADSFNEIRRETARASLQSSKDRPWAEEDTDAEVRAIQSHDSHESELPLAVGSQAPAAPDASQESVEKPGPQQQYTEQPAAQGRSANVVKDPAATTEASIMEPDSDSTLFDLVPIAGSSAAKGTCLATRTKVEVKFVCTHTLANPTTATLRRNADSTATVLCDLGVGADPVMTTCSLMPDQLEQYRSGNAVVVITDATAEEMLIGRVRF